MFVNNSVECESVAPTSGEVVHVDVGVPRRLHLAPQQERVLRGPRLAVVLRLHADVLDLKQGV